MMFWKRKKKTQPTEPGENGIDALANRLQQEGKIDQLESELGKFNPDSLEGAERESWYHLRGIVPFQQGNRPLAFERFQEGVRQCPDSGSMLFSLGQEYEFKGETQQMFECFDKALFPRLPAQYALTQARYAYLWGYTDKGWSYVEPLISVYFDLKILDTTFLHIRGLPFFQETWAYLAAFSQLDGEFGKLTELTIRAEAECHDLDFEYLKAELEGFRSGDFSALKEKLRSSIQESEASKFPCGYQAMRLNVLLAQEAAGPQEAMRLLDSVTLAPNDLPWLDDMRLLAKCEQASKVGNAEHEAEHRAQFMARQPLLFEPDNAIKFNLLRYQESLKDDFKKSRQRDG
jgi:tetratricopeptide (TPR) repeat protein